MATLDGAFPHSHRPRRSDVVGNDLYLNMARTLHQLSMKTVASPGLDASARAPSNAFVAGSRNGCGDPMTAAAEVAFDRSG